MLFASLIAIVPAQDSQLPTEWQRQLVALAVEVADSLIDQPTEQWTRWSQEHARFRRDLELARLWAHDLLRGPLILVLRGDDPSSAVAAAQGLLAFGDPALRLRVEGMRADEREYQQTACIGTAVGFQIALLLDVPGRIPGTTISSAAADLRSDGQDVWFKAMRFLRSRGIVLDTERLVQDWRKLNEENRRSILSQYRPVRSGREKWRRGLEWIWKVESTDRIDETRGLLLSELALADSPDALPTALRLLERHESAAKPVIDKSALASVWSAVEHCVDEAHVDRLVAWSRSETPGFRIGALRALARLDSRRARSAVIAYLQGEEPVTYYSPTLWPLWVLFERSWESDECKWHYLRAISDALLKWTDGELKKDEWTVTFMIDALEYIAQTKNGWNGRFTPSGFDLRAARSTSEAWAHWVKQNDPTRGGPQKP